MNLTNHELTVLIEAQDAHVQGLKKARDLYVALGKENLSNRGNPTMQSVMRDAVQVVAKEFDEGCGVLATQIQMAISRAEELRHERNARNRESMR